MSNKNEEFKRKALQGDLPEIFSKETIDTICRIDEIHHVLGVLYLENSLIRLSTVPESMLAGLVTKLPGLTDVIRNAVSEIDVLDELMAYRIETKSVEIMVAPAEHCIACTVHKSRRKRKHSKQQSHAWLL